jgi:hypothetical protein
MVFHGLVHIPLAVLAGHLVADRQRVRMFDFHPNVGSGTWAWPGGGNEEFPDHMDEADRQTDYMVERLKNKVAADGSFEMEKMLKAGSNAKFTSLRKTEENLFDVDLGAYYSGKGATKERLDTLIQFTRDQLRAIYPNKKDEEVFLR